MDWKFVGQLLLAALAVIATIWVYWADLGSHSLHMRTISSISLQPQQASSLPGLQISFEGKEIGSPYITVLEIINDGSRPIPAGSFELPLEIWSQGNVKILRVQVSEKNPVDLRPNITWTENVLSLKPLLLNSNDSIKFMLITSGGMPEFTARARIEGIASITQEDMGKKNIPPYMWFEAIVAFLLWIAYMSSASGWEPATVPLGRRVRLLIAVSTFSGALLFTAHICLSFALSVWEFLFIVGLTFTITSFIGAYISKPAKGS